MNTDSYFEIGITHTSIGCQDYALNGCSEDKKFYYAIISDGCSSSKHSEVGAQILCYAARSVLTLFYHTGFLEKANFEDIGYLLTMPIIEKARSLISLYNLNQTALDATLMIAYVIPEKGIWYIHEWGDGLIIVKKKDGIYLYKTEYESNAPYYLSYILSPSRANDYKKTFGDGKLITNTYTPHDNHQVKHPYSMPIEFRFEDVLSLTISSDGIFSYLDAEKNSVDFKGIASDFTGHKRMIGEFVKSNMIFMRKKYDKAGITHVDDISCATIIKEL